MLSVLPSLVLLAASPTRRFASATAVRVQIPAKVESKAMAALFESLRTKTVAPVQPYLSSTTRISDLPAAYTTQVLSQLLEKSLPFERAELVRETPEGANVRYAYRITRGGDAKEYDFLVGADGLFLEINLARASVKRIAPEIDAAKLTIPDKIDTAFRLVNGLILVAAEVDGQRGDFVLDTGAPTVRLNRAYFAPPKGQSTLGGGGSRGVNGEVAAASFHHVDRFDWKGLRFGEVDLATFDLSAIEAGLGGRKILGLLGASILQRYALTIDYKAKRVGLVKPTTTPKPDARTFALKMRGHLPTAEFTVGAQRLLLGIDTGAQTNLIDPRFEATLKPTLEKPRTDRLVGVEGKLVAIVSGLLPEIALGTVAFREGRTAFAPAPQISAAFGETPLDGLVGYPVLSRYRTTIDYVHATIRFAP